MSKKLKITESQLKRLVEMYDEPEMRPGKFDSTSELLHSVTGRLAKALKDNDWYLVKEVFMDISHYSEEDTSTHGLDNGDSTAELSQGAMDYNMNESVESNPTDRDLYTEFIKTWKFKDSPKGPVFDCKINNVQTMHAFFDKRYPKVVQCQISGGAFNEFDLKTESGYNAAYEHFKKYCPGVLYNWDMNESVQKIKNQFKRFF